MIHTHGLVGVRIVAFRSKDEVRSEVGIAVQGLDAVEGVAVIHFEYFASNEDILTVKSWSTGRELIDKLVEFPRVLERYTKVIGDLRRVVS